MSHVGDFHQYIEAWAEDLELLRQNWLLSESSFLTFAKERGLTVVGVISGEPGEFHKRGWLASDATDEEGGARFHPFRVYTLHQILQRTKAVNRKLAEKETESEFERIAERARDWNGVIDLAILLEPIYWPHIIGRISFGGGIGEQDHKRKLAEYRRRIVDLVRGLDPIFWCQRHESLRIDAAWIDKNGELYLLLRLANW
jgi:hypothetical protein